MVLPNVKLVDYGIDLKRVVRSKLVLGIADGWLKADGDVIYRANDLKVGLFKQDEACSRAALEALEARPRLRDCLGGRSVAQQREST